MNQISPALLSRKQAAAFCNVSQSLFDREVKKQAALPPEQRDVWVVQFGGRKLFDPVELKAWLDKKRGARQSSPTSETADYWLGKLDEED
jgi:hypothetical protein